MTQTQTQEGARESARGKRALPENPDRKTCYNSPQDPVAVVQGDLSPKRRRLSRPSAAQDTFGAQLSAIGFWASQKHWPPEYAEPNMEDLFARKRPGSLGSEPSQSASFTTPSDQRARGEKSAQYRDPRYEALLETKGTFLHTADVGITEASRSTYIALLGTEQATPIDSPFRDDIFEETCRRVAGKNEARVMRDITPWIVPSAEVLTVYGATGLKCLIESNNEGWNNSVPLTGIRPQPDYSVGFRREAFTDQQLTKLSPFIGNFTGGDQSFFMATYYMYFPFLTCEVKCGAAGLDVADRQNAHSMTLAARAIVELFRLVGREVEVNRQILAFSISHDHDSVRIYGHYPVIEEKDTKYYRHPIRKFCFTEMDGRDKWAAYQFTKNVYDNWMPDHFKNICSAIDLLPLKIDFDVRPPSESTGISDNPESHDLAPPEDDSASPLGNEDGQSKPTLDTFSVKEGLSKRRKSPAKKR